MNKLDLSIAALHKAYRAGMLTPAAVVDYVLEKSTDYQQHNVWISLLSREQIAPYIARLQSHTPESLPLYGIPFALKDNIDLAGIPTTAACPEFSYIPEQSAFVVELLIAAGAIPIGKTNMDQFATGLSGTRSPYGAVKNSIHPDYISGGSSSGSAVATGLGLVSFSLGTDTAGSGRVPAMFNNLIGVKPSCGVVSSRGVVPACRTIDSVSLFALNPDDAARIYPVITTYDQQDCYASAATWTPPALTSEFTFGVIPRKQLEIFGNDQIYNLMDAAIQQLVAIGGRPLEIDFTPFQQAATLLYEGPWVAERYAAIESILLSKPEALFPVTRTVISNAEKYTAADTFRAIYRLRELKQQTDRELASVDVVVTPTAADIYTINAMNENPIELNTHLGYYTNFMNLLDYAAIAIPAGRLANGLPFGITLFAEKFSDRNLIALSHRILNATGLSMGASGFDWQPDNTSLPPSGISVGNDLLSLLVCGAHLTGMPLNHQLLELDAQLLKTTTTSASYRMYCLPGGPPFRPGLVKDIENGSPIDVEIWSLPVNNLGRFLQVIPSPLGLGKVELNDGSEVIGFICEAYALNEAEDITHYNGWKQYQESKNKNRT
jgi:allophanate hydrolase